MYKIFYKKDTGYAVFKWCGGFWQQVSKAYLRLGNLLRYCPESKQAICIVTLTARR